MSTIDPPPLLARYALSLADLRAPTGTVTMRLRDARTRLLRHLVSEGHTAAEIGEAFGLRRAAILHRCHAAGIEFGRVAPREPQTHVPGLVACAEWEATREDCVHEAACLGRLVAEQPGATGARCRPACAQRQAPDRDTRLRLAMVGGIGYGHCCPQHG